MSREPSRNVAPCPDTLHGKTISSRCKFSGTPLKLTCRAFIQLRPKRYTAEPGASWIFVGERSSSFFTRQFFLSSLYLHQVSPETCLTHSPKPIYLSPRQ